MLSACLILITWPVFCTKWHMSAYNLHLSRSYLMSTPFVTGHPYHFPKVSRFPVRQVHFWRCVTCGAIAVALIVTLLLTRPYPFTLWPVSFCKPLSGCVSTLSLPYGTVCLFVFQSCEDFVAPILGFDILLFSIIKSLLKALQALCLISALCFTCTVFWRVLGGAFILVGGVKGANAPFNVDLGLL